MTDRDLADVLRHIANEVFRDGIRHAARWHDEYPFVLDAAADELERLRGDVRNPPLINRVPGFEDVVVSDGVPSRAEIMAEREAALCECGGSLADHRLSSNHNFTPVGEDVQP